MLFPQKTYKRRHFFIKKEFQFRFIVRFCLLVVFGEILSTGLILFFSRGNLTSLFSNSHLVVTDTADFILPAVLYSNLITIILISLAMIVVTLFVSHKIAGPLFRLEKDVNVIAGGDLTYTVRLRKADQLKELSNDINQMTMKLNNKVIGIQDRVKRIGVMAREQNAPQWFQEKMLLIDKQVGQMFKI